MSLRIASRIHTMPLFRVDSRFGCSRSRFKMETREYDKLSDKCVDALNIDVTFQTLSNQVLMCRQERNVPHI
jgi:hypothetical protein